MSLFSKKGKKPKEPQYYLSATNMPAYNYKVYYMSKSEKVLYFLLAFAAGAAVGYLFYGGIGKDAEGHWKLSTWVINIVIMLVVGSIAGKIYLPIRTEQIRRKKQTDLRYQFRELLDALSTSIGSGKNVFDAFHAAKDDLGIIYNADASIMKELDLIISGIDNNVDVEASLLDFGRRSGISDIESFANVFDTCYRKGGNLRDVIRNTQQIITEKMEIEQDIQTSISGSKNEQTIMMFMPILIVGLIKMMSPEFGANFTSSAGVVATTIGVVLFVVSYFVGKRITDIKV